MVVLSRIFTFDEKDQNIKWQMKILINSSDLLKFSKSRKSDRLSEENLEIYSFSLISWCFGNSFDIFQPDKWSEAEHVFVWYLEMSKCDISIEIPRPDPCETLVRPTSFGPFKLKLRQQTCPSFQCKNYIHMYKGTWI